MKNSQNIPEEANNRTEKTMLPSETNAANKDAKKTDEHIAPISTNEPKIPLVEHHIPDKRRNESDEDGGDQPPPRKLVLNCVHTLEAA